MLKSNSKEKGKYCSEAKEEEIRTNNDGKNSNFPKAGAATSCRSQWFRNPRIVRVSRSFGGKDRHSKVCTIRGLRDRRIRLSVPTAIQLYDLQHRLKLGQPSKVIDWLLDVTKLEIDKLPPLQFPTAFSPFFPPPYHHDSTTHSSSNFQFCSLGAPPPFPLDIPNQTTMEKTKNWDVMDLGLQEKSTNYSAMKGKWIDHHGGNNNQQVEDYYNNSNCYNYNSCDQPSSSSSSLFFTPHANSNYIPNNPLFENHIHFLTSNSHALPNPFMSSPLHPFSSQNFKPFPSNFNLNHHVGSSKDGAAGDA